MSDITTSVGVLRAILEAFVPTGLPTLPRYYANSDTAPTLDNAPNGFIYSENRIQDERPVGFGNTGQMVRRDFGEFLIYVYVPRGTKVGTAEAYATQLRAAFPVQLGSGVFVTRKLMDAGQMIDGPNGREYATGVRIEWFADRLE